MAVLAGQLRPPLQLDQPAVGCAFSSNQPLSVAIVPKIVPVLTRLQLSWGVAAVTGQVSVRSRFDRVVRLRHSSRPSALSFLDGETFLVPVDVFLFEAQFFTLSKAGFYQYSCESPNHGATVRHCLEKEWGWDKLSIPASNTHKQIWRKLGKAKSCLQDH